MGTVATVSDPRRRCTVAPPREPAGPAIAACTAGFRSGLPNNSQTSPCPRWGFEPLAAIRAGTSTRPGSGYSMAATPINFSRRILAWKVTPPSSQRPLQIRQDRRRAKGLQLPRCRLGDQDSPADVIRPSSDDAGSGENFEHSAGRGLWVPPRFRFSRADPTLPPDIGAHARRRVLRASCVFWPRSTA